MPPCRSSCLDKYTNAHCYGLLGLLYDPYVKLFKLEAPGRRAEAAAASMALTARLGFAGNDRNVYAEHLYAEKAGEETTAGEQTSTGGETSAQPSPATLCPAPTTPSPPCWPPPSSPPPSTLHHAEAAAVMALTARPSDFEEPDKEEEGHGCVESAAEAAALYRALAATLDKLGHFDCEIQVKWLEKNCETKTGLGSTITRLQPPGCSNQASSGRTAGRLPLIPFHPQAWVDLVDTGTKNDNDLVNFKPTSWAWRGEEHSEASGKAGDEVRGKTTTGAPRPRHALLSGPPCGPAGSRGSRTTAGDSAPGLLSGET